MEKPVNQGWNAGLYDSKIGYVSRLGKGVVELLNPQPNERIIDLGCGTGDLTHVIAQLGASCIGIDESADMVGKARHKYPSISFEVMDGHEFRLDKPVDAVFSNAALHWMKQPERVIESVRLALHEGGRFVAEFGGKRNVGRIYEAIAKVLGDYGIDAEERNPWYFPSVSEYSGLLEAQGFEVRWMELYDRPTELDDGEGGLEHWLDAFAGMFFAGLAEEPKREAYARCSKLLERELYNGQHWIADYRRLRFSAVLGAGRMI
ncbi:methyltransferase domain-containing protein [Paenibacillus radicis (ex Xue et al. 2023)]|uniref:Methyltransferase domain-containing protein n=1 Tax=Paenibacillus radicis (ex Xue et al. 2023) TaxID=2972489 RepID=A0ABT1YM49_9BACL|nr:methyltransferase domain-containing protein [Paenibacillus radicis (ex Xue et al. 2023)]MCR8633358.1 methyltransferase domain-containing protein [Paenibacillus radicis (ex Xue et al. 2023)]